MNKRKLREIRRIHEKRSEKAKQVDESLQARTAPTAEDWMKKPNRLDIQGVDHFPLPLAEGDFDLNIKLFRKQMEDSFEVNLSDLKWYPYSTEKEYDEAYGKKDASSKAYAFARSRRGEIHFSPQATEIVTKGKIENILDFRAINSVAHEILHIIGDPPNELDIYDIFDSDISIVDEGMTEILSNRFTIDNIQMDRGLRTEIMGTHSMADVELDVAYRRYVRIVSKMGLIATDGNPNEAIEWIKKAYLGTKEEKDEAVKQFKLGYYKHTHNNTKMKFNRRIVDYKDSHPEWYEFFHEQNKIESLKTLVDPHLSDRLKKYEEIDKMKDPFVIKLRDYWNGLSREEKTEKLEQISYLYWDDLDILKKLEVMSVYIKEKAGLESVDIWGRLNSKQLNKMVNVIPEETMTKMSSDKMFSDMRGGIGLMNSIELENDLSNRIEHGKLDRNIPKRPFTTTGQLDRYWVLREGWIPIKKMRVV